MTVMAVIFVDGMTAALMTTLMPTTLVSKRRRRCREGERNRYNEALHTIFSASASRRPKKPVAPVVEVTAGGAATPVGPEWP
jgi:L,D-peptidoglycan transpeptidase YkuD (ErfK/YbiS/YcfS/YnhG family)